MRSPSGASSGAEAWAVGIRECLPKLTVESSDVPKQHREDLVMECFNIVVEELPSE